MISRYLTFLFMILAAPLAAQTAAPPVEEELTAPGPDGPLAGTLLLPDDMTDGVPVLLIIPGSGPTDRNGNSPLGIAAAPYELLAEALVADGVPSLRIDKRGMFGSVGAVADPNDVTVEAYADDVLAWVEALRARLPGSDGAPRCILPLGHSEGGLVVLAAMLRLEDPCGAILVAAPGRPVSDILRDQLRANPANSPILDEAEAAIAALEQGERVDATALHPSLQPLFARAVQPFLIDLFSYDPTALAAEVTAPLLIVQGSRDLQISEADARALANAAPEGTLAIVPDANHVLKSVSSDDPAANFATYADPALPIAPGIVDAIRTFLGEVAGK